MPSLLDGGGGGGGGGKEAISWEAAPTVRKVVHSVCPIHQGA